MDSGASKVPYGAPTAPPLQQYYPHPSYPGPPPPQPPPPYSAAPGTLSYGFQGFESPPPPYSDPPPGHCQGYPVSPSGPCIPPPVPPGGYGLYPDLAYLQQQQQNQQQHQQPPPQAPGSYSNTTNPLAPARPAPPLPPPPVAPPPAAVAPTYHQGPPAVPDAGSPNRRSSLVGLKEGETPAGYVVQWRGGENLQLFFLQSEGHVVSPKKPLIMSIYKKICDPGAAEGMVEVHGCWRLRLTAGATPVLHTAPDCYVFRDTSTCPSRVVIIQMPAQLTKRMSEDLLGLLSELTDLRREEGGVVEKVTTGVATVYDDLTHKLNTAVKETVPNAHKSTKWLRKNTGSLVRIGGSLVAKGIHLVADHIPASEKPQEESAAHTELLNQVKVYKKCLEENKITYIS